MEQENTYPTEYRFAVLPDDRSTVIEKARQDYSCGVRSIERILSGGGGLRQSGSILRIKAEYLRAGSRGSNGYAANSSPASERLSLEVADTLTTVFDAAARELERQLPPASLDDLLFGALPFWTFSFLFSLPQAQRFQWELSCAQYWFYAYRANEQRTVDEYAPGETLAGKLGAAELLKAAYRWAAQAMDVKPAAGLEATNTDDTGPSDSAKHQDCLSPEFREEITKRFPLLLQDDAESECSKLYEQRAAFVNWCSPGNKEALGKAAGFKGMRPEGNIHKWLRPDSKRHNNSVTDQKILRGGEKLWLDRAFVEEHGAQQNQGG